MTDALILILSVLVLPVAVGWFFGRKNIDPNSPKGRAYYAKKPETDK